MEIIEKTVSSTSTKEKYFKKLNKNFIIFQILFH